MIGGLRLNQAAIDALAESPDVVAHLGRVAQDILGKAEARAPSWLDAMWLVRAGVSDKGAFAQAIARGSGSILAEYGGARSPAYAMFRSQLR